MTTIAAWHPDPLGEASWRWWDGNGWGGQTEPGRPTPELAPMSAAVGKSAKLDQRDPSKLDVLKCEDIAVGLINASGRGHATCETATGGWNFDPDGVLRGAVRVTVLPANTEIGRFEWDGVTQGSDGILQFPDGRWFRLTRATQLAKESVAAPDFDPEESTWVWYGPDRIPVSTVREAMRFKTRKVFGKEFSYPTAGIGQSSRDIWTDLHAHAASTRETPLLTMLGTYLIWWARTMRDARRGGTRLS